jgi:hypothetical protein
MSLGFTLLNGATDSACNNFVAITNSTNDDDNEDVMHKFNILFESYKNNIIPTDNPDDSKNVLSSSSINFLENVLQIKSKIKQLHKDQIYILSKISEIDKEIVELENIKQTYIDVNKTLEKYVVSRKFLKTETVEKAKRDVSINEIELKDDKVITIAGILYDKKLTLEEYETKRIKIIEEIALLKTIICTNDVTSNNTNAVATCFICAQQPIECCLNPCGHTFCNGCSSRISNQKCYMCRKTVISTTKLFFDSGIIEGE